ncbi:Metallo-dependent phosphatase-like protein [Aspergillus aurantiobrunneus]
MVLSIVTSPRFRRYAIVYLGLLVLCFLGWQFVLHPRSTNNSAIMTSSDSNQKVKVGELDPALLPASLAPEDDRSSGRRLIFIGDVHGCKPELERLLDEVSFDKARDHLIFVGDLITKGPDSLGVLDLARDYSASCVRGNHEDRILTLRHDILASDVTGDSSNMAQKEDAASLQLARGLSVDQENWLNACPMILNVGQIPNMGQVVVAHGGIVPGVDLDRQDPYSVMNMLTMDPKTLVPSSSRDKGKKWTKLFNEHQSLSAESKAGVMTIIYGHDSKSGLSIKEYTKGLDSGCVKGNQLSALVVSDGGRQEIVQVDCSKKQQNKKKKKK